MKNIKAKKFNLKKFLSVFLALIVSLSFALLAGCDESLDNIEDGGTENQQTFFERYVAGFNAVFANKADGSYSGLNSENTSIMLGNIRDGLLGNYGNGNLTPSENINYKYKNDSPFFDSIRMLVTATDGNPELAPISNTSKHWNWNLKESMDNSNYLDLLQPSSTETYEDWAKRIDPDNNTTPAAQRINSASYVFPKYMEDILQVVLYEIMLGYEPTTIEVTFYEETDAEPDAEPPYKYEVKIKNCPAQPELNSEVIYLESTIDSTQNKDYDNSKIFNYLYGEGNGGTSTNPTPESLKGQYLNNSRYTGLTKQNADKLIDYILNEIIGTELVQYDHNTYKNQPVNYRNYVSTIAYLIYSQTYDGSGDDWTYEYSSGLSYTFNQQDREKAVLNGILAGTKITEGEGENIKETVTEVGSGGFTSKPATYVKYFPGENFFGDPEAVDQFTGVTPYAEYQSVVVIPALTNYTRNDGGLRLEGGFIFNFMSQNQNLRIGAKVRFYHYDPTTKIGLLYEFDADEINFTDGASTFVNKDGITCYENDFEFGVDTNKLDPSLVITERDSTGYDATYYTIGFWNNYQVLEDALIHQSLINVPNLQNLYKVIESENGHGGLTVLNERTINTSFFEIVFDVVKSPTDPEGTDYNFSMVLSNSLLTPGIW